VSLVLLHPLPLDETMWPAAMYSLGRKVVAPRLYELGGTIASWASAVIDMADDEPLVLVGNSVGGSCAIEIALQVPDRVELMVLIGTKAGHRPEPAFRDEAIEVLTTEGMGVAWRRYWAPLFGESTDESVIERARHIAERQSIDDVVRGVRVFHSRPDRAERIHLVDVPIVIVSGEYDRVPANGRGFAAQLRRGVFEAVPGAGHYVPLERPVELVEIVRDSISTFV
jgi:pimeloyl-ACP methyl ester carboxylesterase